MKKILLILLLVILPGILFSQVTPKNSWAIPNATSQFGVNISEGSLVYDITTNKYYYCIASTASTSTLTIGSANFVEISVAVTQWITNGTKIYYNDGNIGIGTSDPTFRLSMGNDANGVLGVESSGSGVAGKNLSAIAGSTVSGTNIAGGDLILQSGLGTGTGTSGIQFKTGTTLGSGTTLQTLTTKASFLGNGYFGLNTTAPSSLLTLSCPVQNTNAIQLFSNSNNAEEYVSIGSYYASGNTNVNAQIRFVNELTSDSKAAIAFATGLTTSATEKMRIRSDGKIGIGVTNPSELLDVAGNIRCTGSFSMYGSRNTELRGNATTSNKTIDLPNANGTVALTADIPTDIMTLTTQQTVSGAKTFNNGTFKLMNAAETYSTTVGTTVASASSTVNFPTGNGTLALTSDIPATTWLTNGSNIYYNTGNVGIGVTNPLAGLHIKKDPTNWWLPQFVIGDASDLHQILMGTYPTSGVGYIQALDGNYDEFTQGALCLNPNSGNVGVGTTNPISTFQVNGLATLGTLKVGSYNVSVTADCSIPDGSVSSQWTTNGTGIYYNTGNVGMGITNPIYKLHLEADVGVNGAFDTYHASAKSSIFCRRARGTKASPTKVISGDQLGAFTFFGAYGSGAAGFASGGQAGLFAKAEEDFSGATNLGTKFTFETTATASGTRTEKMVLTGGGRLGIGITNPHQTTENYGTFQSTNGLIELNDSSNHDVNIATGTSTGTVNIGGSGAQTLNFGGLGLQTINIGNAAGVGSSTKAVSIGSTTGTSSLDMNSGSGGISITATSGSAVAIKGEGSNAVNINMSNGSAVSSIGYGSTTGTVYIGGNADQTISLGSISGGNKTVQLGSPYGTSTTTIQGGSSGVTIVSSDNGSVYINNNNSYTGGGPVNIGTGTSTGKITVGSTATGKIVDIINALPGINIPCYARATATTMQSATPANITGLTMPLTTGAYEFEANLQVSTAGATTPTSRYAVAYSGTFSSMAASVMGSTTTGVMGGENLTGNGTATTLAYLSTASEVGVILIKGIIIVGGAGNLTIQQARLAGGAGITTTTNVNSFLKVTKVY